MMAKRLPDGRLRIPVRVTGPGGIVGDAFDVIGPDDPRYAGWDELLRRVEPDVKVPPPDAPDKGK